MNFKSKIAKLLNSLDQKNRLILFFLVGFMVVGFSKLSAHNAEANDNKFQIDTIIPSGYVLIPIKLLNADSISAVIGSYGVADIYATIQGEKTKLLFSRAKIIKSTADETTFAVLVKETKAHLLSGNDDPFFAAVQNPKAKAIESEHSSKPGIRIIYQN
tara:strand:- start:169064 stop:169540 length:477 start_codon:yes stop_codon:yes gene_type:complete